MRILSQERATLSKFLPGLDETLAAIPLTDMERPGNPALEAFRKSGGPCLLVPTKYSGLGASPLQAIRIQRAIASRAPSLAVATAMHHYSIVTYLELIAGRADSAQERVWLEDIAKRNLYVASAFAEGQPGTGVLSSSLKVRKTSDGLIVSGSKKPCSLSASMDLLCASVLLPKSEGEALELVLVTIPAGAAGVQRRPFWASPILAGAESDEVVLDEVQVPEDYISYIGNPLHLDSVQIRSLIWFEMLIAASYLGIATALVNRVGEQSKGSAAERTILNIDTEAAMAALEGVAQSMMTEEQTNDQMARSLYVRYSVQQAIERASARAVELLGGMSFIKSFEVAYLYAAARALAFHPPTRIGVSETLDDYMADESIVRHNW